MPFGDLFPHPEPCSDILLGGEERVKNPFQIFRSNAGAVIVPTQTRDRGAIFKGELFAVSVEELERFSYPGRGTNAPNPRILRDKFFKRLGPQGRT
jgi:hypothetical protein